VGTEKDQIEKKRLKKNLDASRAIRMDIFEVIHPPLDGAPTTRSHPSFTSNANEKNEQQIKRGKPY